MKFLALHVVELCFYRLPYLQLVVDRRHLQPTLQHRLPVHLVEPRMLLYRLSILFAPQPLLRVLAQEFFYQISEYFRGVLGEPYDSCPHQIIEFCFGIGVEGREASIELVEDDSEFIPIGHSVVSFFIDNLKRKVGRRAAERFVDFIQVV